MPALYNLSCDGLLPPQIAIIGTALDDLTTDAFRERMTAHIQSFNTRPTFDREIWDRLCSRLHYVCGNFDDDAALRSRIGRPTRCGVRNRRQRAVLFCHPAILFRPDFRTPRASRLQTVSRLKRIIVEKPFGIDLASAKELNREILGYWDESQVYRVDHYLGKETVQNILAFRFANGMFEPLWNKQHIDHIQFSVAEAVGVEGRGGYYDHSGVLRDMIQNHMLQMLAYVCMEAPISFEADDVRNEKAKLLNAVRIWTRDEASKNSVRGQYGPGKKADGTRSPAYREEPNVDPQSNTETFAACDCLSTIGDGMEFPFICVPAKRFGNGARKWSFSSRRRRQRLSVGQP